MASSYHHGLTHSARSMQSWIDAESIDKTGNAGGVWMRRTSGDPRKWGKLCLGRGQQSLTTVTHLLLDNRDFPLWRVTVESDGSGKLRGLRCGHCSNSVRLTTAGG